MAKNVDSNETKSAMDYPEHERTYAGFLWLTKWSVIVVAALLISMAIGFFGGFGLAAILVFAVLLIIAYFIA